MIYLVEEKILSSQIRSKNPLNPKNPLFRETFMKLHVIKVFMKKQHIKRKWSTSQVNHIKLNRRNDSCMCSRINIQIKLHNF